MARLSDVQRASLASVRNGYQLGRKATSNDLIGELKDARAKVGAEFVRLRQSKTSSTQSATPIRY